MKTQGKVSRKLTHFWHTVSNIRPIFWIMLYIGFVPVFAFFYWLLPDGQFRIPDMGGVNFGDWVYYSIVTLTTLGFGDYTPCAAGSQWITAIEVLCGLVTIGFFLNAVGSMKSEIDVESELEKQRLVHEAQEKEKLQKSTSILYFKLNQFLSFCYAVTTPVAKRGEALNFNANFTDADMADKDKPSGLPDDHSQLSAVENLMKCSASLSLFLDTLQSRIDLTLWPELLEDCFAFVANFQMLSSPDHKSIGPDELAHYIRSNAAIARNIEIILTQVSSQQTDSVNS